jgi:hypothetical protein
MDDSHASLAAAADVQAVQTQLTAQPHSPWQRLLPALLQLQLLLPQRAQQLLQQGHADAGHGEQQL